MRVVFIHATDNALLFRAELAYVPDPFFVMWDGWGWVSQYRHRYDFAPTQKLAYDDAGVARVEGTKDGELVEVTVRLTRVGPA